MPTVSKGFALAACAGMALAAGLSAAAAQDASRMTGIKLSGDMPIAIESDNLEVKDAERMAIFSGNVNVVQGDMQLKAGKMTVHYAAGVGGSGGAAAGGSSGIDRIDVADKVYVQSKSQVATGDTGSFDMKTEVLVLSGSEVVLSEGENVIKGCKLTVQMKTGQAKFDGCGQGGGRIQMLLQPKSAN